VADAGARLHRLAVEVGDIPRTAMIAAAKASKRIAGQEVARYSPMHLHRKGRPSRSVKLRAVDDIRTQGPVTTCRVQGLPVGPWVWLNTGTGHHLIGTVAKGGRRRRRGTAGPQKPGTGARLELPRGWATGPVGHPGGSGHGVWRKVTKRIAKVVPDIFTDAVREAVSRG
jgi:hypothetical protein